MSKTAHSTDKEPGWEYVYNIKAIATIAVVFLHSASPYFYQWGKISNNSWIMATSYDSFVRFAVPVFLMVSGSLLLGKDYDLKEWFRNKVLSRLLLPFLFYFLIHSLYLGIPLSKVFVLESINYQFPFVGIILSLYLLFPIIRKIISASSKGLIIYTLTLILSSSFINFYFPKFSLFNPNLVYGYLCFPLMGYLLNKIDTHKLKWHALFLYLFSSLLTLGITALISFRDGKPTENYFKYLSPNVILMSIGIFIFIKNCNVKLPLYANNIRNFISEHSYGIFFLHPLILPLISTRLKIDKIYIASLVTFLLGMIITTTIIFTLSKIPIIRKLAG